MNIIYKFVIPIKDTFSIEMPQYSRILNFQVQGDNPVIWTLSNKNEPIYNRNFMILGTGFEIPSKYDPDFIDYVGTIQMDDSKLVWHLFDLYSDDVIRETLKGD